MSWDKNTVNQSEIDTVITTLKDLDVKYELVELSHFLGMGLNDAYGDEKAIYLLRKLTYKNITILEYVERDADCDTDDVIKSQKFTGNVPQVWQTIRWTDKNHTMEDDWEEKQNKEHSEFVNL